MHKKKKHQSNRSRIVDMESKSDNPFQILISICEIENLVLNLRKKWKRKMYKVLAVNGKRLRYPL